MSGRAQRLAATILLGLAVAGAPGCGDGASSMTVREPAVRQSPFDATAAMGWVRRQVELGPRPAGSRASRRLAGKLRAALPRGRYQAVPGGLRNVIGTVPGRDPRRVVVVGAHYDTKDIPGFVGAIDGASGTAVVVQLARAIRPRQLRPTVVFALFDGEESPRGTPDTEEAFRRTALRGSKVAAQAYSGAQAMVLLDFVGNRNLTLPREALSDRPLWARMRAAARRAGHARAFPPRSTFEISDDHLPFLQAGVPAIDLIDFDFACWHRRCDDLAQVSQASLRATGESVLALLLTL
ncbi:MAG: glutaminyl-peptide cyclotransferase [Thermoleophilaceae bacterium]|nr:glutaminyl-peptide cyclotransferase [Thermoleophilaceae bacterium]